MKTLHILIFLFLSTFILAQSTVNEIQKSTKIEKIDGVKYYLHTVEAGQTVYSIAKAYDVNHKDVIFENPEVVDGVSPNQIVKIPVKEIKKTSSPMTAKAAVPVAPSVINHTVEKQQTLYAISKLYAVSIEEITNANPEISEGLKIGQIIKIPQTKTIATEVGSAQKAIAKDDRKEEAEDLQEEKIGSAAGKTYSVALLLPFNIQEIDTTKFLKNIKSAIPSKSYSAIEFYEGFLTAIDSVKNLGLNLKLNVFDAPNDSLQIVKLLEKPELQKSDLIIGPFHNIPAALVASFAKRNHIPNVIPYAQQNKVLLGNKYAIKVTASINTQVEAVAVFICKKYSKQNIVVLHNGMIKEKPSVNLFKQKVNSEIGKDTLSEVIFKTAGIKGLESKLVHNKDNIIFVPSNDQAFVTSLVNGLRSLKKTYKIILVGMESWVNFDNLDINTIQDLQVHLPSSNYINYSESATVEMMKKYRKKYKTDPSKYAFQGYDCGLYFLSFLYKEGKDFNLELPSNKHKGLQSNMQFTETAVESGYENKSVYILQYKDFTLSPEK